jgi:hypothetical protein
MMPRNGQATIEVADAALAVLLNHLLDYSAPARFNQVEIDAQYVEALLNELQKETT